MKRVTARHPRDPEDPGGPAGPSGPLGQERGSRRLRADAARNRAAIVSVASDVFAEQGLEAPLEAIAARAGVGIATLYRRFPTREKLVAAALVEKVSEYAEATEPGLTEPARGALDRSDDPSHAPARPRTRLRRAHTTARTGRP